MAETGENDTDSPETKRRKLMADADNILGSDDPPLDANSKLNPSDPLALNQLIPPRPINLPNEQPFKVVIIASVVQINFSDVSVPVTSSQPSTITLKVWKGFHKDPNFYEEVLKIAQSKLRSLSPCQSLKEQNFQTSFEKPNITYNVVMDQQVEKRWIKYPITDSLLLITPPSVIEIPNHSPHAQFFINFELATDGPQKISTPPPPPPEEPAKQEVAARPPSPVTQVPVMPEWPNSTVTMVEQMTELAFKYPIFSPTLVMNKLARIFQSFRKATDSAFASYEKEAELRMSALAKKKTPTLPQKLAPQKEKLWQLDVTDEGSATHREEATSSRNGHYVDRNTDARKILDRKQDHRDVRDRGRDRSRGYDRPYDRSGSRGPDRYQGDQRRDDGFYRGQRKISYRQ